MVLWKLFRPNTINLQIIEQSAYRETIVTELKRLIDKYNPSLIVYERNRRNRDSDDSTTLVQNSAIENTPLIVERAACTTDVKATVICESTMQSSTVTHEKFTVDTESKSSINERHYNPNADKKANQPKRSNEKRKDHSTKKLTTTSKKRTSITSFFGGKSPVRKRPKKKMSKAVQNAIEQGRKLDGLIDSDEDKQSRNKWKKKTDPEKEPERSEIEKTDSAQKNSSPKKKRVTSNEQPITAFFGTIPRPTTNNSDNNIHQISKNSSRPLSLPDASERNTSKRCDQETSKHQENAFPLANDGLWDSEEDSLSQLQPVFPKRRLTDPIIAPKKPSSTTRRRGHSIQSLEKMPSGTTCKCKKGCGSKCGCRKKSKECNSTCACMGQCSNR
jgi:hypothetical protein